IIFIGATLNLTIKYKIIGSGGIILKNIANVKSKKHHKFLITAVCIATLGAQFAQITNVKADDSIDSAPQEQIPSEGADTNLRTSKTSNDDSPDLDEEGPDVTDADTDQNPVGTDTDTTANVDESTTDTEDG